MTNQWEIAYLAIFGKQKRIELKDTIRSARGWIAGRWTGCKPHKVEEINMNVLTDVVISNISRGKISHHDYTRLMKFAVPMYKKHLSDWNKQEAEWDEWHKNNNYFDSK